MRPLTPPLRLTAALLGALLLPAFAQGQASPSIQFFMPDGTLPPT